MTTTYSYTGSEQTHDVSNLDRISTTLWGAGGEDGNDSAQGTGGAGGLGGYAEAEIDVSAISTLHIYVAGGNGNIWGYNDGEDATSASNDGGNGAGETSIRVWLDEAAGTLEAEEWDDTAESWTSITAVADGGTATDWSLYDIDLTSVAMVDVRAQLEFAHPTDGLFDLDVSLQRGQESLLVEIPEGETGPIPSGLESWLELIVSASAVDPQPSKGLVSRKEVRR
jgi:hypothetical protein